MDPHHYACDVRRLAAGRPNFFGAPQRRGHSHGFFSPDVRVGSRSQWRRLRKYGTSFDLYSAVSLACLFLSTFFFAFEALSASLPAARKQKRLEKRKRKRGLDSIVTLLHQL